MLRPLASYFFVLLFTGPVLAANCVDTVREHSVKAHIHQLRPTQMEYGEALVDLRANKLLREAARAGVDAHTYLIERNSNYVVPAVISPRGEFFVTDSHHGISAIYKALGKHNNVVFNLDIAKDYREPKPDGEPWSYSEFIEDLLKPIHAGGLGKGQFTPEVRGLSYQERFVNLPVRFDHLRNNPIRSLVGEALKIYGVKRKFMIDYVDFMIAERVLDSGYPAINSEFTRENIEAVADTIFSTPSIVEFMKEASRSPELDGENKSSVSSGYNGWRERLNN